MNVSKEIFLREADAAGISPEQVEALWTRLSAAEQDRPKFDAPNVAYYFGGLIIIGAMTFFFGLAWERMGAGAILALALAYTAVFAGLGVYLFRIRKLYVAGGLLTAVAVCLAPLVVYAFERALNLWPAGTVGNYLDNNSQNQRFSLEIATLVAGAVALRFVRFPFLVAPMAFTLWIMSTDLAQLFFHLTDISLTQELWISVVFGVAMMVAAFWIDRRTGEDYAFWLYFFGVVAFWFGLTLHDSGSPWLRFVYCLINIGLLAVSTFLDRRVFAVFGSLGVALYLGYLAFSLFKDSLLLPVVLTAIGLAVIAAAIAYQKNRARVDELVIGILPEGLRRLSPARR